MIAQPPVGLPSIFPPPPSSSLENTDQIQSSSIRHCLYIVRAVQLLGTSEDINMQAWKYSFLTSHLCYQYQGCAGRPFIPRGGAGRGEKARKSTNSKNLQKCEKYNITYYNINYKVKVKESFIFLLYFQKHVLLSLWRLHNVHIIFTIHL